MAEKYYFFLLARVPHCLSLREQCAEFSHLHLMRSMFNLCFSDICKCCKNASKSKGEMMNNETRWLLWWLMLFDGSTLSTFRLLH